MSLRLEHEDGNLYEAGRCVGHVRDERVGQAVAEAGRASLSASERRRVVFAVQLALRDVPGWRCNLAALLRALGD